MNQAIIDQLNELFAQEPLMRADGVGMPEIDAAEKALHVSFSKSYREFLSRYGGALVGPYPVYGLARAEPMDAHLWSVIAVTEHFRSQSWPGVDRFYVISMDHAGNPIGIDGAGKAFSFDHDGGEMIEVANDFENYLQLCLAKL